jgi:hypothetical protein
MESEKIDADFRQKKVALNQIGGPTPWRVVDARVLGELAVHKSLRPYPWDKTAVWDVSHIPTGFSVARRLTEQNALEAVKALVGLDWNFERPEDLPLETKKRASRVLLRFKCEFTRRGKTVRPAIINNHRKGETRNAVRQIN